MYRILKLEGDTVVIGCDDNSIRRYPASCLNYPDVKIGDVVEIYGQGDDVIIAKAGRFQNANSYKQTAQPLPSNVKRVNKHLFVWVFNFLLGAYGVDRFVRGQIGTGVCKLIFGAFTLGIWYIVDLAIAIAKAYGSGNNSDDLYFVDGKYEY